MCGKNYLGAKIAGNFLTAETGRNKDLTAEKEGKEVFAEILESQKSKFKIQKSKSLDAVIPFRLVLRRFHAKTLMTQGRNGYTLIGDSSCCFCCWAMVFFSVLFWGS